MSTADAAAAPGADMGAFTTKVRLRTKRMWSGTVKAVKWTSSKIRTGAKRTGKAVGTGFLATVKAAVFAVRWTIGVIGVAVFWTLNLLINIVGVVLMVVALVVLGLAGLLIGLVALLGHIVYKWLLTPALWLTYTPAKRERAGNSLNMFIHDRSGSTFMEAVNFWTDLSGDEEVVVVPEETPQESKMHYTVEEVPVEEGDIPAGLTTLLEEATRDQLFEERVQRIEDNDLEDMSGNFPGADPSLKISSVGNDFESSVSFDPTTLFAKFYEGQPVGEAERNFDFSAFDDVELLLDFYEYLGNEAREHGRIADRSYWEGRGQFLYKIKEYLHDPEKTKQTIDQHGRLWALVHQRFLAHQDEYSLRHLRAGFMDEQREQQAKRLRREQAAAQPMPAKKQTATQSGRK